nr:hypothetical protein [uncultured Haemophilus sp.]
MELANVRSSIGWNKDGESTEPNSDKGKTTAITPTAAKMATSGLLTKTGDSLNKVITVGDLQAIAQAGLDFNGNALTIKDKTGVDIHKTLGSRLIIEGEGLDQPKADAFQSAAGNILVASENGKLVVKLNKSLSNLKSAEFKDGSNNPVTTLNNNGLSIQAPPEEGETSAPKAVSVTKNGINAGDKAITNVAGNLPNTLNALVNSTQEQLLPTNVKNDNAATVGDILNAGWNLQGNDKKVDFVKAYDTVNFVNGDGTTAIVANQEGKTSTVKYSVNLDNGLEKTADNKIKAKVGNGVTVDEQGISINTGKGLKIDAAEGNKLAVDTDGTTITDTDGKVKAVTGETEVISTTVSESKKGQVKPKDADKAKLATVQAVVNAVNSAKWFAKADNKETAITDAEKTTSDNGESMAAGDELTLTAGKNLRVKRDGKNFTFATVETPEFESLKLTKDGNTVNVVPTANGLNLSKGGKGNSPVRITGVTSGLNNYANAPKNGLRDLSNTGVTDNTAATVGDLRNMGWVVTASDNNYHDQVRNANQVDFVGSGLAKVSGETTKEGVRKITVSVQMGEVLKDNEFKDPNGTKLVKIGDNYYSQDDIDPATGEPKANVPPKYKSVGNKVLAVNQTDGTTSGDNVTLTNNNAGVVTGKQVADSIQQSGWNVGLADADKATKAFTTNSKALSATELEKVNRNDNVRFANGKNTVVKASTVTDIDANGNKVTNTYIRTDINGLPVQYTNASGVPVTKVGDKFFTVDKDGNLTTTEVDAGDLIANVINPAAKPNEIGSATQLGNVANGANTFAAPKNADGNELVKANDGNWYKANNVNPNGTVKTDPNNDNKPFAPATPVANSDPKAGLVDFANSNANNAATVGDLQNMGWVVSASDNGYNDQVRHINKVDFKGGNGIDVKGETLADGTRQLTVGIKEGSVTNRVEITKEDGSKVDAVVIDGKYYERDTDGKPTNEITLGNNDKVTNNAGSGFVTGNTVANAINESGWNVGLADQAKADEAFADSTKALAADKLEKVNPDDNVRFADGKNTKVKAATVDEVNKDGKKVTNSYVKVDVDLPISQISAVDATGNKVVKDADGNWYPAKADGTADKSQTKVDPATVRQSATMDPDGLGNKYSSTATREQGLTPAQLGELVGKQTVAADKAAENVAKLLEGQPQAVVNAAKDAARKAAEDEVKTQYLKDNSLDKGIGGTVITNVAWGKAPSDAVNVDQLQNSGWNVDSRQVEGSNGKVISGNTSATKVKMDETVNIDAGNNIEITRNGRDIAIATSMDPTFNTVKIGSGEHSVNLSNTNVAPGDISANSTDAINGAQIYALAGDQTNVTPASHSYVNSDGNKVDLADKTVVTDKDGEVYLRTYNVQGQEEIVTNNVLEAVHNINEQAIKFFHSNDGKKREKREDKNRFDSSAAGTFTTAIASKASAEGENAVAIGVGTVVKGDNSISIGIGNKVSGNNSGAFGDPSIIDGHNSYSVGNNTLPTDNTFVLGNNVTHTTENSVFLGTESGYVDAVTNPDGSINERTSTTAGKKALTKQITGGLLNQYA